MNRSKQLSLAIARTGLLRISIRSLLAAAILSLCQAFPESAQAEVFGLKSRASNPSGSPTHLFSFVEDGSSFTDLGTVTLGGSSIDADALAISQRYGLLSFQVGATGSRLLSIDSTSAEATVLGALLNGRDIRGATFDSLGVLWAIDSANNELLQIDPTNGQLIGDSIGLTVGGGAFNLSNASDIAVRSDGQFYLSSFSDLYTLNIETGSLTQVHRDARQGLAGLAFVEDELFAYDVRFNSVSGIYDNDDIFLYDTESKYESTLVYQDIIPSFNSGRGDLAALPVEQVPEPSASFGLLAIGAATAGSLLKGKKRSQ